MASLEERVSAATHDLANLLGIAANYLQFLEEDLPDDAATEDARAHIARISAAVDRAAQVARDLGSPS